MIVSRLMRDVVGQGCVELLPSLVAEEYVGHLPLGDHYGPDGIRIDVEAWRSAFPDLAVDVVELLAVGDRVVRRFVLRGTHHGPILGVAATGRHMQTAGIAIDHLVSGRLTESWVLLDLYGLARQLGVTAAAAPSTT